MNITLPPHICDFETVARDRLTKIGGPQAALRAESDNRIRDAARQALADIGVYDLNVRAGGDDVLAAAVLCQVAGAVALPYPVTEDLLATDGARLALLSPEAPRVDHGDLPGPWLAYDLDRRRYRVDVRPRQPARLGPFLTSVAVTALDAPAPQGDIDTHLILGSWRILGAMQRCLEITCDHVRTRTQFGKPLAEFQAVRFAVADATVALQGFYELAKYTVSRIASARTRTVDAYVLRLKAIETARQTLRTSHQLLGALGFCDESDVSVLDRHTQPLLRHPESGESLALRLVPFISDDRFETLFSESA